MNEKEQLTREDIRSKLERLSLKLDNLSSIAEVCAGAFVNMDSFSNMRPLSVHDTFYSISDQAKALSKDLAELSLII